MACNPERLRQVPLFALLDDDEMAVLASQVELQTFAPRHRIYRAGEAGGRGYIVVSGVVRVTTVDEDQQEVVVDQPAVGEFFGFASMLDQTPHQTSAVAAEGAVCIEVDRHDIMVLLERKPHAGMDMLPVLGKQYHGSQRLVRVRSTRNPNEVIEERTTTGESVADAVARFGGSGTFIISFGFGLAVPPAINVVLSMLASVQAPVIMMSQNRQDVKDRLRGELDYAVNRRAESEIQGLARKLNLLGEKLEDVEELVRDLKAPR